MPNELELILMILAPEIDPHISGNLDFTASVDTVDIIRGTPIVLVLQEAVSTVSAILTSAETICRKLGFLGDASSGSARPAQA
jgi:hypothetical protein